MDYWLERNSLLSFWNSWAWVEFCLWFCSIWSFNSWILESKLLAWVDYSSRSCSFSLSCC